MTNRIGPLFPLGRNSFVKREISTAGAINLIENKNIFNQNESELENRLKLNLPQIKNKLRESVNIMKGSEIFGG